MIKLFKCGGLYTQSIERWHSKITTDKNIWETLRQHLISEYENLVAEGGGKTLGQEGYEAAFNVIESTMDDSSITESIVRYAEHATAAEGKLQGLEDCLNQL